MGDGLQGIGLGGADQPHGPALDPARRVQPRHRRLGLVHHAALHVGDDPAGAVEADLRQLGAEVADGPVHGLHRVLQDLAGGPDAAGAVQLVALHADRGDLPVLIPHDLRRGLQEVQVQAPGGVLGALGLLSLPLVDGLDQGLDLVVGLDRGLRGLVVLEVLLVQHDVHVPGLGQLPQLQRGELHLGRPTAAEDVHIGDRGILQPGVDVFGDLGDQQVLGVLGQHPRHVQGDVAVAQHRDLLRPQRPLTRHIRVPVVPGDEVRGPVGAVQLDAGDVQGGVVEGAGGEDDGVVVLAQLRQAQVRAVLDVAEEPDVRILHDLVQRVHDALDPRVIRGHAVADQAEGRGVAVEDVDADAHLPGGDGARAGQQVGGVDPGGAGPDDGHAQGALVLRQSVVSFRSTARGADSRLERGPVGIASPV